jgi:cytoskeletal protein RodZ
VLRHYSSIPPGKSRDAYLKVICRPPKALDSNAPGRWFSRLGRRDNFNMKMMKSVYIALFGALLLVTCSVSVWAQAPQQTGDQNQSDSSTPNKGKKTKKNTDASNAQGAPAPGSAATSPASTSSAGKSATAPATPASTPGRSAPASKTAATQQVPPANSAGMVWVNTDSGVYHKPGTRWYGKTKQGKYMTEADAQKAGYRAAAKQ